MTLTRRNLLKQLTMLSIASMSTLSVSYANTNEKNLKPKRLKKGMTIGLVSPASNALENLDIHFAIDVVKSLGFKVKTGKHLFERNQYLAGTDKQRADDLNTFFADDTIDAIFCLRGGYGTLRILPFLDYKTIQANPKVLMGYSDITSLLNAIYSQTGLIGYHGPIAKQNMTDYTLAEFKKVLMSSTSTMQIAAPPPCDNCREGYVEYDNRLTTITGGKATGKLIGGNLSVLASMLGTPFEPDFSNSILFLEDVSEAPYRVDRMLTQLWLHGALDKCTGIALGRFTDAKSSGNSFSIEEVLFSRLQPLGIPVLRGLMIGHIDDQTVVPIGLNAQLDADKQTLTLLEPAVS